METSAIEHGAWLTGPLIYLAAAVLAVPLAKFMGLGAITAREAVARRLSSTMGRLVPVLSAGAILGAGSFFTLRSIGQLPI